MPVDMFPRWTGARCTVAIADAFFPMEDDDDGTRRGGVYNAYADGSPMAKHVCAMCPIRLTKCLPYVLAWEDELGHVVPGIWGGTGPQDRRRLHGWPVKP